MSNGQQHADDEARLCTRAANAAHPEEFDQDLRALTMALEGRGLSATFGDGVIVVQNPAELATDPHGRAMSPDLKQRITLAEHDGARWWWWIWPGPTRDAPCEIEPMVPATDAEEAARRLANVLRISQPDGAQK